MTTPAISSEPHGKQPFLPPKPPCNNCVPVKSYSLPEIFHCKENSGSSAFATREIGHLLSGWDLENKENEQIRIQAELISSFHPRILNPAIQREVHTVYFRGCSAEQFIQMIKSKSAGGVAASKNPVLPTEEAVRKQVVGDSPKDQLPEFTKKFQVAHDFSKGGYFTVWAIASKHLVRGSISEDGYVCSKDTPVRLIAWTKGPPLHKNALTE